MTSPAPSRPSRPWPWIGPEVACEALKVTGTDASGLPPVCTGFAQTNDPDRARVMPLETVGRDRGDLKREPESLRKPLISQPVATDRAGLRRFERAEGEGFEPSNG